MALKKSLGRFGSRYAFEFALEVMRPQIVKSLQKYLSSITPEKIGLMIEQGELPPLEHLDFSAVGDNVQHLKRISTIRLMEYLAEARPDLAGIIQDKGIQGAEYMVKLRRHLLDLVERPAKPLAESTDYGTLPEEMALSTCDKCKNSWPVEKGKAQSIDKCPFCGQ